MCMGTSCSCHVHGHSKALIPMLTSRPWWCAWDYLAQVDPEFLPDQPDPESDFCPLPILHHEPWNTMESWYVWNVTSHLLQAGPGFCARPAAARRELFDSWRARLNELMAAHRGNNAFIVYSKTYEGACARLQVEADARAAVEQTNRVDLLQGANSRQAQKEARLTRQLEALRQQGECDLAGVTTADLIDSFGNDTELTLSMAKRLLEHGPLLPGTMKDTSPCASQLAKAERSRLAHTVIGPLPADDRVSTGPFLTKWGAWSLTLGSAYHKIVPVCEPADPLYHRFERSNWRCDNQPLPSEPDGKLVYDLLPVDASRGYCYGPSCAPAARAIDTYRAFLHTFSSFRTQVIGLNRCIVLMPRGHAGPAYLMCARLHVRHVTRMQTHIHICTHVTGCALDPGKRMPLHRSTWGASGRGTPHAECRSPTGAH